MTVEAQSNAQFVTDSAEYRSLSLSSAFCLSLLLFCCSALAALVLSEQREHIAKLGFSGLTVPDALSLDLSVSLVQGIEWSNISNIRTFLGVVLVYFPSNFLGYTYTALVNVFMLALAATIYHVILQNLVPKTQSSRIWFFTALIVSTNIYIIECLFYANKEIPLILLTTLAIWGLLKDKWLLVLCVIFSCYWFRDGYSLILAMVLVVALARRFVFLPGAVISSSFLVLLFLAFPISDFSSIDASLQRNVQIGAAIAGDKFSAFGNVAAYGTRLVGNALNLGLRPQVFDTLGGIYLLGVGYWQFGVVLLGGLMWSVSHVFSNQRWRGTVALISMVVLLGISYGTFVQPRYMMPLIFPLSLGLCENGFIRFSAISAALLMPGIFAVLGLLPPLAVA